MTNTPSALEFILVMWAFVGAIISISIFAASDCLEFFQRIPKLYKRIVVWTILAIASGPLIWAIAIFLWIVHRIVEYLRDWSLK